MHREQQNTAVEPRVSIQGSAALAEPPSEKLPGCTASTRALTGATFLTNKSNSVPVHCGDQRGYSLGTSGFPLPAWWRRVSGISRLFQTLSRDDFVETKAKNTVYDVDLKHIFLLVHQKACPCVRQSSSELKRSAAVNARHFAVVARTGVKRAYSGIIIHTTAPGCRRGGREKERLLAQP